MFKRKPKDEDVQTTAAEPEMVEKVGDNSIEKGMPEPDVAQTGQSNMKKVGLFLGLMFATGLIVMGLLVFSGDEQTNQSKKPEQTNMVTNTQKHDFGQDKNEIKRQEELLELTASEPAAASEVKPIPVEPQPQPQPQQPEPMPVEPQSQPQPQPMPTTPTNEPQEKTITPQERKLTGDVLVSTDGSKSANVSGSLNGATQPENGMMSENMATDEPKPNALESQLQPTVTPSTSAKQRGNMDYVLAKGTNILCTLDTQIITTRAGFTRCVITRDIYSANGKVLLLEKGSKIVGEQTAAMLQGQARVGILWNEVTTPNGVTVSLASPAAGQLGAAGVGARVKYHFWQRFGGAVMISLIGDLGDYYSNRANSGSGDRISFENSSETAQDMATEALKNSINIPPTGYINHGTLINIMVARDVDFSGVYERVNPYTIQ